MACNARASESQVRLALIKEVSCGVTPSNPGYQVVPHLVGSRLQARRSFEETNEIDSSRQGGKLLAGTKLVDGPIITNLVNELGFDWLMESAIGAQLAQVTLTVSVSYTTSTKKIARAAGSFLTDAYASRLAVGDKVAPVGSANNTTTINGAHTSSVETITLTSAANFASSGAIVIKQSSNYEVVKYTSKSSNDLTGCTRGAWDTTALTLSGGEDVYPVWTISAISATEVTFSSGDTLVDETAVSTVLYSNRKRAASGSTRTRFSIEEANLDLTLYQTYKGMEVGDAEIAIGLGQGQATFNMLGQNATQTQESGATYTAKRGSAPMSGTVSGTLMTEDGSTLSGARTANIRITNGREAQFQLGTDETDHVSEGNFNVEVGLEVYRGSLQRITDHLAGTRRAFVVQVKDASVGDAYRWTVPNGVYRVADKGAAGNTITDQATVYAEKDDAGTGSKLIFEKIFA